MGPGLWFMTIFGPDESGMCVPSSFVFSENGRGRRRRRRGLCSESCLGSLSGDGAFGETSENEGIAGAVWVGGDAAKQCKYPMVGSEYK